MAESLEQSIVSLLEEHVELAISTVQELRADKLELEAEIARLKNEVARRDAQIQRLEECNRDLEEKLNLEQLAISQERTDIRERLEGLMNVLAASNEAEAEAETVPEMDFTIHNQEPNTAFARSTEDPEEE